MVICDDCGEEIPEGKEVRMMDLDNESFKTLCMDCYYEELVKEQEKKEACNGND